MIKNINEKVKNIICLTLEDDSYYDRLTDETNLVEDIGMDSIQIMQIVISIEIEFDIEFNDDELLIDNLAILKNLIRIILSRLNIE